MAMRQQCPTKHFLEMSNCNVDRFEEAINISERFQLEISGRSMLPFMGYDGDKIIVRRISHDENINGRIVLCRVTERKYVAHRVIRIEGDMITMRGDGRLTYDKPIPRTCVVGIVESVVRKGGRVKSCATHTWRICEHLWLCQPTFIRRCSLGIIRRFIDLKEKK